MIITCDFFKILRFKIQNSLQTVRSLLAIYVEDDSLPNSSQPGVQFRRKILRLCNPANTPLGFAKPAKISPGRAVSVSTPSGNNNFRNQPQFSPSHPQRKLQVLNDTRISGNPPTFLVDQQCSKKNKDGSY